MRQWFNRIFIICVITILGCFHVFFVALINAAEYKTDQQLNQNDLRAYDEPVDNLDDAYLIENENNSVENTVGAGDSGQNEKNDNDEESIESDLSHEESIAVDVQEPDTDSNNDTNNQHDQKQGSYGEYLRICTPENKVPTYRYDEPQDFVLEITNISNENLYNISITPVLQEDSALWPFRTDFQEYKAFIEVLNPKETTIVRFEFVERENVLEDRYNLIFIIGATDDRGKQLILDECSFYVNITGNTTTETDEAEEDETQNIIVDDLEGLLSGMYTNGTATYISDSKESVNSTVPRVIVTGFDLNPSTVKPGQSFRLSIHVKNTSKTTSVSNLLFELEFQSIGTDGDIDSPAFYTTNRSNDIYLDKIEKEETADISIDLVAATNLSKNSYQIKLGMKYEDKDVAQIACQSSISIPIHQDIRLECSEIEIAPKRITVGDESNVTCSIYNLGKVEIYNLRIVWEGDCIEKEEVFLGNVQPGMSALADVMLKGTKVSNDSKIMMNIIYENEGAEQFISTESFTLTVENNQTLTTSLQDESNEMKEKEKVLPAKGSIFIVVIILGLLGGGIVYLKKSLKRSRNMENSNDELEGFDQDKFD